MKTKKLLSILLALMMMLSVVPFYASAATALKATNVTEWPIATGEIFYGQMVGEGITISGGKVEYNGVEVPGKFVHWKDTFRPLNASDAYKANLTFVPDDTAAYSGFNKLLSADVIYKVKKTTPVWMNENDLPVATSIVSGQALSASTISGGTMKNPYNDEETAVQNAIWQWTNPDAVITETGEYEAYYTANEKNYEKVTRNIYVEVKQNIYETEIIGVPTIEEMVYGATWNDVILKGIKAVVKGTETEVAGAFKLDITNTSAVIPVGTAIPSITFIPDDTDKYLSSTTTITVTVNPAPIKFVDENGNEIVPEITVPYGTTFGDIHYYLESYVAGDDAVSIGMVGIENANKTLCETGTYTASLINRTNSNYERTEKEFKIIVEAKKLEPTVKSNTGYYVVDDSGTYNVEGTFDVYIDGELYKSGVKYLEKVAYVPETSGTHEIKFVYKPIENDNFAIENEIKDTFSINLVHKLTLGDNVLGKPGDYRYSTEIELSANSTAENFEGWVITDAAGNTVDLGVDLTAKKITITMPDYDIHVEALEKNASSGGSGGLGDIDFGDLSEGDSEWAIINIIRNIIAMFKSFLQQLIETFQSIGD